MLYIYYDVSFSKITNQIRNRGKAKHTCTQLSYGNFFKTMLAPGVKRIKSDLWISQEKRGSGEFHRTVYLRQEELELNTQSFTEVTNLYRSIVTFFLGCLF